MSILIFDNFICLSVENVPCKRIVYYSSAVGKVPTVWLTFADCNNRLTSFRGAIESPNYPQPYPMGANCVWIIETTIGNTINASFSRFETVSHGACRDDYLEVTRGGTIHRCIDILRYFSRDTYRDSIFYNRDVFVLKKKKLIIFFSTMIFI